MTTTDIAAIEDGQYAPAIGAGPAGALGVLSVYADAIDMAYNFAEKLCRTPLVGAVYRGKPADAAVAILYGAELGLNPIQALQNVFTVHGTPAIYARTMVALLKVKGYRIDPIESSNESVTVVGYSPTGQEIESTWTIERARQAGYVPEIDEKTGQFKRNANDKLIGNEKYITDPQAMLYAKAAAEVCRKLAPDVLLGIAHTREDLESEPEPTIPVRVTSERVALSDLTDKVAPGTPGGVPVKNWEPPAEEEKPEEPAPEPAPASDEVEKQDTTVEEPPAEWADAPLCTTAQQRRLAVLLDQHGVKGRADKLAYLTEQFKRKFTSSKELTKDEASGLIEFLSRPIENGDESKAGE